jgi:hypothetical protein
MLAQETHGALPGEARRLRVVVCGTVLLEKPVPDARVGIERHLPSCGPQGGLRPPHLLGWLPLVHFGVVTQVSGTRTGVVCLPASVEGDPRPHHIGLEDGEQERPARPGREAQCCHLLPPTAPWACRKSTAAMRSALVRSGSSLRRCRVSASWTVAAVGIQRTGRGRARRTLRRRDDRTRPRRRVQAPTRRAGR